MSLNEILGQSRFVRSTVDVDELTKGFSRVSVKNLFLESRPSYDVYFPVAGPGGQAIMQKLLGKGQVYDPQTHQMLNRKGFKYFYVPKNQVEAFEDYFVSNLKARLASPNLSSAEKTDLLYSNAEYIVEKAFNSEQLADVLPQSESFAKEAAKQFSRDRTTFGELLKIFSKDYHTYSHSIQVCFLGMAFCLYMGYSEKETAEFGLGALFHDIGKSEIDDSILNKPSKLTADEWTVMKKHPLTGYERLLKLNSLTEDQLVIVLQHHEDMNGQGYPLGLNGPDIHRCARIVRIVDSYDALTTRRSYKEALTPDEAFQVMEEEMKPALDEKLLKRFWEFTKVEERTVDPAWGVRLSLEIGSSLQMELAGKTGRHPAKFIGMEPGHYLIVHVPNLAEIKDQLFKGKILVLRYMAAGTVYGFESKVIALAFQPARLLFLTYPVKIQSCEIRKHARFNCVFFSRVTLAGRECPGIITNISLGGCQFVTDQLDEERASQIKIEDPIALSFQPLEGKAVSALPGEVRNVRRGERRVEIGIRFLSPGNDLKDTLAECIRNLALANSPLS